MGQARYVAQRMTAAAIEEHFNNMRRDPFKLELIKLIQNSPTSKAIQAFANKAPDRYWQSVTQAAKLAGFSEKLEVDIKFKPLSSLADSELRNMLQDLSKKLDRIEVNTQENKTIEMARNVNEMRDLPTIIETE